jgi:hypothetical protein
LAYIEGFVPVLGLDHFVHVHILRKEADHSLSMHHGHKAPRCGLRPPGTTADTLHEERQGRHPEEERRRGELTGRRSGGTDGVDGRRRRRSDDTAWR